VSSLIKPTIGRVVWYWPTNRTQPEQPHAAIIAHVWRDDLVNLAYFDSNGIARHATSVVLRQGEGDQATATMAQDYCEWMPYQKGQAAKAEQLERDVASLIEPVR
jgi:hypothetical protein